MQEPLIVVRDERDVQEEEKNSDDAEGSAETHRLVRLECVLEGSTWFAVSIDI